MTDRTRKIRRALRGVAGVRFRESGDCIKGCDGACIRVVGSLAGGGSWSITKVTAFLIFPANSPHPLISHPSRALFLSTTLATSIRIHRHGIVRRIPLLSCDRHPHRDRPSRSLTIRSKTGTGIDRDRSCKSFKNRDRFGGHPWVKTGIDQGAPLVLSWCHPALRSPWRPKARDLRFCFVRPRF